MMVTCIESHYSPTSWSNIVKGFTYEYVEMNMIQGVWYITIKNEGISFGLPSKFFDAKDFIRDYFLDKLLENE